jgi:hypothetical protein
MSHLHPTSRLLRQCGVLATLLAAAACSGELATAPARPALPDLVSVPGGPLLAAGVPDADGYLYFCKSGPAGKYNFLLAASGGAKAEYPAGMSFSLTLNPGDPYVCTYVYRQRYSDGGNTKLSITELPWFGSRPSTWITYDDPPTKELKRQAGGYTTVLTVNSQTKQILHLTNNPGTKPPRPNPLDDLTGCSAEYWQRGDHMDRWVGYSPVQDFDATFGVDLFAENQILFATLTNGRVDGGVDPITLGKAGLAREATAALLNASNPAVKYGLTPKQVVDLVRVGVLFRQYDLTRLILEVKNERTCPLP